MSFLGGGEVSARVLRDIYPLIGASTADVAVNNTIDWEVVPGLTVIVAPQTAYALTGYVAWDAAVATGIRVGIVYPPNALGRWGMQRMGAAVTTGSGVVHSTSSTNTGPDNVGASGGSSASGGALYGLMRGYLQTGRDTGSVQVVFTQNVSNAAFVSVKAGSWMTLTKMGDV